MIEHRDHITRAMLRAEPDALFVFGDNLARKGFGGQAKEMRGENNAIGIPTKRFPSMAHDAYLRDRDFAEWAVESGCNVCKLLAHEGKIVWPAAGIGTGLAQLQKRTPRSMRRSPTLELKPCPCWARSSPRSGLRRTRLRWGVELGVESELRGPGVLIFAP